MEQSNNEYLKTLIKENTYNGNIYVSTGSAVSNVNMVTITSCQAPILQFGDQCFSLVRVQMTYDIDITIIKQFAILMDMNDAILAS